MSKKKRHRVSAHGGANYYENVKHGQQYASSRKRRRMIAAQQRREKPETGK